MTGRFSSVMVFSYMAYIFQQFPQLQSYYSQSYFQSFKQLESMVHKEDRTNRNALI